MSDEIGAPFETVSFLHEGEVCVLLPENSGFEPDQDITLIRIAGTIYIVHAEDTDAIDRLLKLQLAAGADADNGAQ